MAEANVILPNASLEQGQEMARQDSEETVSKCLENNNFNELSSRLHEHLEFYPLFNTFIQALRATIPCDSIEYENKETQNVLVNGSSGKHHCQYTLKHAEQCLGVIRITRDSKLLNNELDIIETMLAGLILPLRNALRHQQTVRLAQRDALTGLRNSRFYHDVIDLEINRSLRYKAPFSLLMFGLDDFDNIRTIHSHRAGDEMLHEFAARISKKARSSDVVYRIGSDQFLVFLPNTDKAEAGVSAARIKDFVLASACECEGKNILFALSAGVVTVGHGDTADTLIDRANKAMFHAKILGKNRIYTDMSTSSVHTG